jgi:hypothetical protein
MSTVVALLVGMAILGETRAQEKSSVPLWRPRVLGAAEIPLPEKVARADIILKGRVDALEDTDVEVPLAKGSEERVAYRVAVVKVNDVIHGDKEIREIRVAFAAHPNDKKDRPRVPAELQPLRVGEKGLMFLKKHPREKFFVHFALFGGYIPGEGDKLAAEIEQVRRFTRILEKPVEALRAENADDRYLAVTMLITHYRSPGAEGGKEEATDAEESKLLMKGLAEADWKDRTDSIYPPHPAELFAKLGVTKADGFEAKSFRDIQAGYDYIRTWVRGNQDKYRLKRWR